MKTRIEKRQRADCYLRVNGEPHGFRWDEYWVVEVTFDSREEAEAFAESLTHPTPADSGGEE